MDKNLLNLLKYKAELELKGQTLAEKSKGDYLKLINYEIILLDHLKCEQQDKYILIIADFLNKKTDVYQYIDKLFNLERKIKNSVEELKLDFEKLEKLKPNLASKGFSDLITELCTDCRLFEPDADLDNEFEVSETELINNAKTIFLQIQKYSKK